MKNYETEFILYDKQVLKSLLNSILFEIFDQKEAITFQAVRPTSQKKRQLDILQVTICIDSQSEEHSIARQ